MIMIFLTSELDLTNCFRSSSVAFICLLPSSAIVFVCFSKAFQRDYVDLAFSITLL